MNSANAQEEANNRAVLNAIYGAELGSKRRSYTARLSPENKIGAHMRFRHPSEDIEFEIPDAWWVEANAHLFSTAIQSFEAISDPQWPTVLVPVEHVVAPLRGEGVDGMRKERTILLLQAIVAGVAIPPLEVHQPPLSNRLAVRDGFHRYFISVALGFPLLPVSVRPYFDFYAL